MIIGAFTKLSEAVIFIAVLKIISREKTGQDFRVIATPEIILDIVGKSGLQSLFNDVPRSEQVGTGKYVKWFQA